MMRIAIVDDDIIFAKQLHRKLDLWFHAHHPIIAIDIHEYHSGTQIKDALFMSGFDLFFLDIEMPGINGLETASLIRKEMPAAIIIFITSYEQYAPSGYRVQALRYLSKPIDDAQFDEALKTSIALFERIDRGALSVFSYGNVNRIPYRDILYVRHVLRYSLISTASSGIIKDSRGINDLFRLIEDKRFLFIDRGTFVNVDYIQRLDRTQLTLINGESLSISRRMLPNIKVTINRLLGGK